MHDSRVSSKPAGPGAGQRLTCGNSSDGNSLARRLKLKRSEQSVFAMETQASSVSHLLESFAEESSDGSRHSSDHSSEILAQTED